MLLITLNTSYYLPWIHPTYLPRTHLSLNPSDYLPWILLFTLNPSYYLPWIIFTLSPSYYLSKTHPTYHEPISKGTGNIRSYYLTPPASLPSTRDRSLVRRSAVSGPDSVWPGPGPGSRCRSKLVVLRSVGSKVTHRPSWPGSKRASNCQYHLLHLYINKINETEI